MRSSLRRFALVVIALTAIISSVVAQAPPQGTPTASQASSKHSLERRFFRNLLRDQRDIWTMPFHLQGKDARWLVPLAVGTAALISTDRRTAKGIGDNATRLSASRQISKIGIGYAAAGTAAAFYLVGRATDNGRARETGLLGAEALINGIIVSQALKVITQRSRPIGQHGGDRILTGGRFFRGGDAFPSGHAISAWSLAAIVAHEYDDRRLVQVSAYGLASLVSVSRFTGRRHYLSDVLIGSAIGYGIGRHVFRTRHDASLDAVNGKIKKLSLSPHFARPGNGRAPEYGLSLVWSF